MNQVVHPIDQQQQQPENTRDLRAEIGALMRADKKLTQAEIARQSGVNQGIISAWLAGTYSGNNDAAETKLTRWVDAYKERQVSARLLPEAPTWVATPSGKRISSALSYAQIAADIAVIYGGAGLGKSTAIFEYQRAYPNVFIATMTPATTGVVPCLEEIAEALGIRDPSGGARKIQRDIIARLRGSQGLLIIDEAQHLTVQALDAVRSLHDVTGVGLALVGNEAVYARMTGGNRAAYLDRLYSRIGKRVRLTKPTAKDIDALIVAWGIKSKESQKALHEIAAKPGALRGLTKVLRLASMVSDGRITAEDIKKAWRDLGGET